MKKQPKDRESRISVLSLVLSILEPQDRKRLFGCSLLVLVVGLIDVLGLASLIPLISTLVEPDKTEHSHLYAAIASLFGVAGQQNLLWLFFIAIPVLFVLKNTASILAQRFIIKWIFSVSQKLSERQIQKFYSRGYDYLMVNNTFKTNYRTVMLPLQFSTISLRAFMQLISEGSVLLVVIALTAIINLNILLLILAFAVPTGWLMHSLFKRRLVHLGKEKNEFTPKNSEWLHKLLDSFIEFKIYNTSAVFLREYLDLQQKINQIRTKKFKAQLYPKRVFETAGILAFSSLGAYFVGYLNNPEGFLVMASVFVLAAYRMNPALISIIQSSIDLADSRNTMELLADNLNDKSVPQDAVGKIVMNESIKLEKLSFNFGKRTVFENVSITIHRGEIIGISGESGVGKSTLGRILLGFVPPSDGSISVDQVQIQSGDLLPTQFGYISAQTNLLNSGVYENVALKMDLNSKETERIKQCLSLSKLDEFVNENKKVGLDGKFLSTGQQQRIALARAIYFEPKILILDEFTANLDEETEKGILANLLELHEKLPLTIVLFSHKASTLAIAQRKFQLEKTGLKVKV